MLIALAVAGVVLGLASTIGLRLQRQLNSDTKRFSADQQLTAGAELLPIDLRAVSPMAGDIPPAGARDTSLEIRATIASGVVCAAAPGILTLAFHRGPVGQVVTTRAAAGDTLWLVADTDSVERWHPVALTALRHGGQCPRLGGSADGVFDIQHPWLANHSDSADVQSGVVARITRRERYVIYRAGDGQWYLGLRTWNAAAAQFNVVQPVSGPYRAPSSPLGTSFRYFDSTGALVPPGASDTRAIARVEMRFSADRPVVGAGQAIDSLTVVVALRNRDE